jgi:hypothetical protein
VCVCVYVCVCGGGGVLLRVCDRNVLAAFAIAAFAFAIAAYSSKLLLFNASHTGRR